MKPAVYDLDVYKGDTCAFFVRLWEKTVDGVASNPVDLTGATAKAQIRIVPSALDVLAEFACEVTTNPGVVKLSLPATITSNLSPGVWDLEITFADGVVQTYLKGNVSVTNEVTRDA